MRLEVLQCGDFVYHGEPWMGHSAGAFEMSVSDFDAMIANHNKRGIAVQIDFEHALERRPHGIRTLSSKGVPASGWVHALKRRGDHLWGLCELLEPLRDGILAGRYCYVSPAVRLESVDTRTGRPQGARLSSLAITSSPFLGGLLKDLVAASDKVAPADVLISLRDAQASVLTLTERLRDADDRRAKAEELVVTLHDRAISAESKASDLAKRVATFELQEEDRIITERHLTWRDQKPMGKPSMLALFRANRAVFDAEFPPVDPDQRHLMNRVTPPAPRPARDPSGKTLEQWQRHFMSEGLDPQQSLLRAAEKV